jgi:hypothetical protein
MNFMRRGIVGIHRAMVVIIRHMRSRRSANIMR